jgi:hypothetical protein
MAFLQALATASSLPAHEALSGVFGSISLATWIFVLVTHHAPTSPSRQH